VTLLETGRVMQSSQIGQLGTLLAIRAPEIAVRAHAGQYVHARPGTGFEPLLRRPHFFCRIDRDAGEIELLVKALGVAGEWIASRRPGDTLDLLGPLGTSFVVHRATRNLLLVAGGTGIAPLRVLAEQEGDRRSVTLLMGESSIQHLWPSSRLPAGVEYLTSTEDGSFGRKGRVTEVLPEVLSWADQVLACGPWPMLAALGRLRQALGREPAVSPGRAALLAAQIAVEQHLGCAMGVCRGCVIVTPRGNERVCREGPVFDLAEVLFEAGEPATVGAS
jgi:dihydroorotate dehydrogenase electron transfer subunit